MIGAEMITALYQGPVAPKPAAMLAFTSCSSTSSTPGVETTSGAAYQQGEPGGVVVETHKMTATVTGIDADNRKVTLVTPDGKKTTVKCGPEVINFDQIQVGDQLKIRVTQELAVRFLHGNYAVGLAIPFGSMTVKGDITHTGTLGSSRQLGKASDTSSAWPRGEFGRASRMLTDDHFRKLNLIDIPSHKTHI